MDLSTRIAANEQMVELLQKSGRMKTFVQLLASNAVAHLKGTGVGTRTATASDFRREKGMNHTLWKVGV